MFHHHNDDRIAYSKADKCEKVIYYADEENSCDHKQHVAKSVDKCSLCDHHTLLVHGIFLPSSLLSKQEIAVNYFAIKQNFCFSFISVLSNRGPPVI